MAETEAQKKARLEREKKRKESLGKKVGGSLRSDLEERRKRREALLSSL